MTSSAANWVPLVGRADAKGSAEADNVGSVKLDNERNGEVDIDGSAEIDNVEGPKLGGKGGTDVGTAASPESDTEGSKDVTAATETVSFVEVLKPTEVPILVYEGRPLLGMPIEGRLETLGLPPGARTPSIALISVLSCCRAATTRVRGSTPGGTTPLGDTMLLGTTLVDGELGAEETPVAGDPESGSVVFRGSETSGGLI